MAKTAKRQNETVPTSAPDLLDRSKAPQDLSAWVGRRARYTGQAPPEDSAWKRPLVGHVGMVTGTIVLTSNVPADEPPRHSTYLVFAPGETAPTFMRTPGYARPCELELVSGEGDAPILQPEQDVPPASEAAIVPREIEKAISTGCVPLGDGWQLHRVSAGTPYAGEWFLVDREGDHVARFWHGPKAGEDHCCQLATSIAGEIARLQRVIERDRSEVARGVAALRHAIAGRTWMTEGRGSFEYNDDRYQAEFGAALAEIEAALQPLGRIAADLSDSPTERADIEKARGPRTAPQPLEPAA